MFVAEIVRKLKRDELVRIAQERGVSIAPDLKKLKILDLLEKASAAKRPEEKITFLSGLIKKTRIRLMPKNPLWGFAYWDIDAEELKAVVSGLAVPPQKIIKKIRIFNVREDLGSDFDAPLFFDEEVSPTANSSYIRFGVRGARYYLELGLYLPENGQFISLCRSNTIGPGSSRISVQKSEKWIVPCDNEKGYSEVKNGVGKINKKDTCPGTDEKGGGLAKNCSSSSLCR